MMKISTYIIYFQISDFDLLDKMCHAIEKVYKMAMGTFPKSENFAQKLENLINQTSLLTGKISLYTGE